MRLPLPSTGMRVVCVPITVILVLSGVALRLAAARPGAAVHTGRNLDDPPSTGWVRVPFAGRDYPLPKSLKVNFCPFGVETINALTPENIEKGALLLPHLSEREYRLMLRSLSQEMAGLKKGTYRFSSMETRLRVERDSEVILVDAEGMVKTRTREYVLQPRSFLDLSELLTHVGSQVTKAGDKETVVEPDPTIDLYLPR